ncbi:DUF4062 domain-containing protein [Clostridium perfringens]|uniref:DUF4062 domain-containing protein n=1 Tax=Clostridium perfringens TaxID=1502 RepID=UPI0013E325A3|nr:DUF4062 domain-containing protein [Clostridium perfringens]MCI2779164.1 DUF4062 domain-containing protein [Clostridium perfringens]NGT65180.1 DUF4062 domain-containing protein [Clostridium perfringens]
MEKRYQIFISSTFADLQEERKAIMEAIMDLNCFPAGMEMFPANDSEQFEYIKTIIDESDYYVLVLAGRYGSVAEDGKSYTEKEFDYAKEKGIPVLVFTKKDLENIPVCKTDNDSEKKKKLEIFREKAMENKLAKYWDNADELKYGVLSSLSRTFKTHPRTGWVRGNIANNENLLNQINDLRIENDSLKEKINEYNKEKSEFDIDKNTLASGQDLYTIEYSYFDWTSNSNINREIDLTWDDIAILMLRIIDRKFIIESSIKGKFEEILDSEYLKLRYDIYISDIQFKKILMQLEVLGLIQNKDGFFEATKKGDFKYVDWLLVKNQ